MNPADLQRLLEDVQPIAVRAGQAILAVAREDLNVQGKSDGSPLTRADLASHNTILDGLGQLEPALPIVSEESFEEDPNAIHETFWLVDPLDGTKEFIKGLGDYTVNIALVDAGLPVLGVVYVPAQNALYFAARGAGAHKIIDAGQAQPIHAAQVTRPASAVVSRSHLDADTEAFLQRMNINQTLARGSSVKICAVAEGSADVYPRFGPTCLWDTAAGAALAREAGCEVIDLQGQPLSYALGGDIKVPGFLVYPTSARGAVLAQLNA